MIKVFLRDVDGSSTKRYKTVARAVRKFESMVGYSIFNAIDEQYWSLEVKPKLADLVKAGGTVHAVGTYGNTATICFDKPTGESA